LQRRAPEEVAAVEATVIEALQAWRDTMCAETEAAGGSCVDLLEAFNGSDGTEPAGDLLAADYTHPSQLGNDRIRGALLDSGLYPIPAASPAG